MTGPIDPGGGYTDYQFVAELYDHVPSYEKRGDVAFYLEMAAERGGPVLEIGCGTGRVLIPIARQGQEITGLDLSPHMLKICRERLAGELPDVRQRAELVQADMRSFQLDRQFQLITIPFRPFQHLLTVEDQLACLQAVHHHLAPGGRFILDIFNPSLKALAAEVHGREEGSEPTFVMPDGRLVARRSRILRRDPFQQISDIELIYYVRHPDGRTERLVHRFQMRHLFRFEAEHLLARAGLQLEQVYADYQKTLYGEKYPGELIMVARKEQA